MWSWLNCENLIHVELFSKCVKERWTWRNCEDFAAFDATMFIILCENQSLEKNSYNVSKREPHNIQVHYAIAVS